MNIQALNMAILNGQWTNTELMAMTDTIKWKRKQLTESTKRELTVGDTVNFTSSKQNRNITGTVVKIAIKYVTVRTLEGLWKVPANMLSKVDEDVFA